MSLPQDFAHQKPNKKPASIDDIFTFKVNPVTNPNRPGWELTMDMNFSLQKGLLPAQYFENSSKEVMDAYFRNFFNVDADELARLPEDVQSFVQGWRTYFVKLGKDAIAGGHYHRIKKEIFTVVDGEFVVKLEDAFGNKKEQKLDKQTGMIVVPFISHEVIGVAPSSTLKVVANMAYDPADVRTQDTWLSRGKDNSNLESLQAHYKHS